jgi:hypothetical protein
MVRLHRIDLIPQDTVKKKENDQAGLPAPLGLDALNLIDPSGRRMLSGPVKKSRLFRPGPGRAARSVISLDGWDPSL